MSEYADFDLDSNMDDVADIISYSRPPAGQHVYGIVYAGLDKITRDKELVLGVVIIYQYVSTIKKSNEEDMDVAVGSLFSEQFDSNPDMGKKWLKKRLVDIFGEVKGNFGPYIKQLNDKKMSEYMLQLTTSIAESKKDGKTFENVRIQDIKMVEPVALPENFEVFEYEPNLD